MGIPLTVAADIFKVLDRHGVKTVGFQQINAVIAALEPCFQKGYLEGVNGWPLKPDPLEEEL